ncbi:25639_t:CDS:2 [Dentiscutata erythropus]|uniref:25639_t:CDS:1 n=1 Tax=Dentiscutata erythropus TaxID=1348616 RepID=A0A9N9B569_9GLOM|nr:25639_t:CDS:2 [Dentiscutata erythropus]
MGNRPSNSVDDESGATHQRNCIRFLPSTQPTRSDTKYRIFGKSLNGNLKYPLPSNIEEEKHWLQDPHYLIRHMWQSNYSAPIEDKLREGNAKILNICCDYGTWTLEMASDYPNSHFTGVDVAPIFPSGVTRPNVRFLQSNVLDGLPFESNSFDFVLVRLFGNNFTEKDWEDKIIHEIVRLTKPGGWVELTQPDSKYYNCGPNGERWNDALLNHLRLKNINGSICEDFGILLTSTGQISRIQHEVVIGPVGSWGNRVGELGASYARQLSGKFKPWIISYLDITEEEYNEIMIKAEQEFNIHRTYMSTHRFVGQKINSFQ